MVAGREVVKRNAPEPSNEDLSLAGMKRYLSDSEWDINQYEARKVIVRIDRDGEPVSADSRGPTTFASFFFVCWRGLESPSSMDFAECSRFPMSPREILARLNETPNPQGRKLSRESFVAIPAACIYFLNHETGIKIGVYAHPDQSSFFPELIVNLPDPITQPFAELVNDARDHSRVIVACRNSTGRIPASSVDLISIIGRGVELRVSRIAGAGRGVYVTRPFQVNEVITLYFGHIFGERQRQHMQSAGIGTHCKPLQLKHSYLDGVKTAFTGMGAGQLVNQGSKSTINCDWVYLDIHPGSGEKLIGLRATRKIYPGEELYVHYGSKYWSEQSYEPTPPPDVILPSTDTGVPDFLNLIKALQCDLEMFRKEQAELRTEIADLRQELKKGRSREASSYKDL